MDKNFETILNYVKTTTWNDSTDPEIIIKQAHMAYKNLIPHKTKQKKLYRLCGQTGSGKTTQLLSSVEKYMNFTGAKPVILGVRTCAEYHPNYTEISKTCSSGEIREKTNGFALKCMTYVLKLLIENGYMILFDITLLDPVFEKYVLDLLQLNNYQVEYHILAVNREVSDKFLQKRFETSGRITYKSSADYFYKILPIGLEYICSNDKTNYCYVWSVFNSNPLFYGKICDCILSFKKGQSLILPLKYSEDQLREAKYLTLIKNKK